MIKNAATAFINGVVGTLIKGIFLMITGTGMGRCTGTTGAIIRGCGKRDINVAKEKL
jgi:hypothetical protein